MVPVRLAAAAVALVAAFNTVPNVPGAEATTPRPSVFVDGDMPFLGSTGDLLLNRPIVDLAVTPSGAGYWLLAGDGGIFSYGDAAFHGSTGAMVLNSPVVSFAPTPTGKGYWLAASDGGVFTFGDARFLGSAGSLPLVKPVVGIVPTRTGRGYWLVASDGGVFTYGDAPFLGSLAGTLGSSSVVALAAHGTDTGYGVLTSDQRVFTFGASASTGPRCGGRAADLQFQPNGGYEMLCESGNESPVIDLPPGGRAVALGFSKSGDGRVVATTGRAIADPVSPFPGGDHVFIRLANGRPVRWNPCRTISWFFDPTGTPAGAEAFIVEGMEYLARLTGLPLVYAGASTAASHAAPSITVRWGQLDGAVGYTSYRSSGAEWATAVVTLTSAYQDPATLNWNGGRPGTVFLHEMGHALGLGHPNDPAQLMHVVASATRTYQSGDLAGLWHLSAAQGCVR